ncbi:hypothetical protein PUMCH_005040 [Australozyma saopauloensis]|uniref:NAD-dependent epimerase/dehydratase domain-containing protein n=1 Tax=Australozyma saopauloensis TaxID=291208 RepID=A0AAX4HGW0_9ASCO|nr:hypothetical protein PUMCH_005040 [[Candida] saopauloensis]
MKSIAVFGGNGFLGRKLCEVGVRRGWSVTSFSRSGKAPKPLPGADSNWMKQVNWEKADLFDPASYREKLAGKSAIVHSVGILFENTSYKKTLNLDFNPLKDMDKVCSTLKGPNPMERTPHNTYAAIQRDSALLAADAFLEENKESQDMSFVYISADSIPPVIIPEGYLTTKREAEYQLARKKPLRSIFMRPGFMFDPNEGINLRLLLGKAINEPYSVLLKFSVFHNSPIGKLFRPAASTEQVANTMYEKLENPEFSGVVSLEEIRKH